MDCVRRARNRVVLDAHVAIAYRPAKGRNSIPWPALCLLAMNRFSRTHLRQKRLAVRRRTIVSSIRQFLWCLLAIGLNESSMARAAETVAFRADDFLNSIGVCSAVSRRGENLAKTIEVARYLGIRWFRAGYESGIPIADLIELHNQTGVRFSYGLMSGGTDIARLRELS